MKKARDFAVLLYVAGNVLTFNHYMKLTPRQYDDAVLSTMNMWEAMFVGFIWPVYWALKMLNIEIQNFL